MSIEKVQPGKNRFGRELKQTARKGANRGVSGWKVKKRDGTESLPTAHGE